MTGHPTIAVLAKRTAAARRGLVNLFSSPLGEAIALDLMGLPAPNPAQVDFAGIIAQTHSHTLAHSDLYLADPGMVDLLDTAAPTMPDQELLTTDIPTPYGFVYFADPLPDRSGTPPELPLHALSWAYLHSDHPILAERDTQDSVLITSYVLVADQAATIGRGPADLLPDSPKYIANATVMWTVGSLIGEVFGDVPPPGRHTPGFYQRVAAAFWTLSQQPKMTTTTPQSPGQPSDVRRYRRAGIADPAAPVSVVRIHHRPTYDNTKTTGSEHTDRRVKVRFPVRGFWRRQWHPSVQQHRQIWVDPHWRGPEGGPVVGGERVFLAHGQKGAAPK